MATKKNQVIFDILANTKSYADGMAQTAKYTDVATKAMKVGFVALTATVIGASVAFGKFEQGMSDVSTIIDNSTESIKNIGAEILKVSKEVPKPIDEMVKSMYDIRSAGIASSQAMSTLRSAGKLAVAGLSTTAEATDILTTSLNLYKDEGLSANQISNILFKTVKYGKNTVTELAQSFGATAPLVKNAGVGLLEFSAATAALTAQGIPASVAQNNLRAAMVSLQKETAQMSKIFQKLGVKDYKELISSSKNLGDAFTKVKDTADSLGIPLVKATGRVEGANAITVIATAGAEIYTKALYDMAGGADAVDAAFQRQSKTLNSQKQLVLNLANSTLINLGEKFQTGLLSLTSSVKGIFKGLNESINKNGEAIRETFNFIMETGATSFGVISDAVVSLGDLFVVLGGMEILKIIGIAFRVIVEVLAVFTTIIKTATTAMSDMMDDLQGLGTVLKVLTGAFIAFKAVGIATAIWGAVTATNAWAIAMGVLNAILAVNPFVAIAIAVLALGALVYDIIVNFNEWKLSFKKLVNAIIIGWKKAQQVFTGDETDAILQKQIDKLKEENTVIEAQTEALRARKQEMLDSGKANTRFGADSMAGAELDSGKLDPTVDALLEKKRQDAITEEKKKGEQARFNLEQEAAVKAGINKENQHAIEVARNEEWFQQSQLKEEARYELEQQKILERQENGDIGAEEAYTMKEEAELAHYQRLQMMNDQYWKNKNQNEKKQDTFMFAARKKANAAVVGLQNGMYSELKDILLMAAKDNKAAAMAYKAIAIGESVVATYLGATKALAEMPFPANIAAAGLVTAKGLLQVNAIRNQSFAVGTDYVPNDMTANIHKGEGIIPAKENQFLQSGKMALVSSSMATGNSQGNASSELKELIEAIKDLSEQEIEITMKDDAMDFIEAQVIKRRALNTGVL